MSHDTDDPFTRAAVAGRTFAARLLAMADAWKTAAPIFLRLAALALTHPTEAAALRAAIPEPPC